tara:strand:+ start:1648 stop:1800 length:153 start_codon:yes stop_codon:yes gene_type:complete
VYLLGGANPMGESRFDSQANLHLITLVHLANPHGSQRSWRRHFAKIQRNG